MKSGILVVSNVILLALYFSSCHFSSFSESNKISSDPVIVAQGEANFAQYCSSCHNFKRGGIGPSLAGLTDSVSADWIQHFIRDPKKIIESGDERANQLYTQYKVAMPSFAALSDEEIKEIIAFIHAHKKNNQRSSESNDNAIANPFPDSIGLSNLVAGLELITQLPSSSDNGKRPLARIAKLDFQPNTGELFILDLRGRLYRLHNNKPSVYMDMTRLRPGFIDKPGLGTGFGSFAFHPDFENNGLLYTVHTETADAGKADFYYADSIKVALQYVLTEWKTQSPGAPVFSGASRELMRINMISVMHGVQEIAFNPLAKHGAKDYGLLYVSVGDGGCVDEGYPFLTHSLEKIWGAILRIDPMKRSSANGQYGIPEDNPFVNNQGDKILREVYAYGFRNAHRITWSKAGQMLAVNIGQSNIESVNLVKPGGDYGWPIREGAFVINPYGDLTKIYPLEANDSIYNITYPVAAYDHDWGFAAISGGYEYSGTAIPQLKGKFLFGDIPTGRLFYIIMADIQQGRLAPVKEWKTSVNGVQKTLADLCGNNWVELRFGRNVQGEMYILTKTDGKLYKLVSATLSKANE